MSFMDEEIVFLVSGEVRVELVSSGVVNSETAHICYEVNNLHQAMTRMDSDRKTEGPYTLTNGWMTVFYEGPNGEIIELLQNQPF